LFHIRLVRVKVGRRVSVLKLLFGELPAVMALHPPLLPLRAIEGLLILDVARVIFALFLHQALIALGDGEPALLFAVAGTVIVGEEARRHREELRLLE
jgi:hypothetical protein